VGTSIALHLAKKKIGKIILLEKAEIASGQTGYSSAIIRLRYWNEVTARIAFRAWQVFRDFRNQIGGECGFTPCGQLWLVDEKNVKNMEQNMRLVRQVGGDVRMVMSADEILSIEPLLSLDGVAGAAWEPNSGYADPALTTSSYVAAGKALGVEYRQSSKVESILHGGGRVKGVKLQNNRIIKTSKVVNAAGFWAKQIAKTVGVELPISMPKRHLGLFRRPNGLGEASPVISDFITESYYRPFGKGITKIGSPFMDNRPLDPDHIDTSVSWEAVEGMTRAFLMRFPKYKEARYESGYSYAYDYTPDHHPILDEITTSGVEGFYCAVGSSGHGFKESPITGPMMADLVADGKKSADIEFFRFSRFEEGKLIYSPFSGG